MQMQITVLNLSKSDFPEEKNPKFHRNTLMFTKVIKEYRKQYQSSNILCHS